MKLTILMASGAALALTACGGSGAESDNMTAADNLAMADDMAMNDMANIEALRAADAATFDQTYLMQQIAAHQKALAMVQGYAQSGDVPALQQHATAVAGPIQQHLNRARELSQQAPQ